MKCLMLKPTRLGNYLLGLNFILFLLAIGYSNNLLFLFTLILVAQTLYWYVETLIFNHPGIKDVEISHAFSGELTTINFIFDGPRFSQLKIKINNKKYKIRDFIIEESKVSASLALPMRGKYLLNSIEVYDSRPFSLFAKTIKFENKTHFYVYPKLITDIELKASCDEALEDGPVTSHLKGEEDFLGLSPYQGEDFKKISWKQFARTDELYIKQGLLPLLPHLNFVLTKEPSEEELSLVASQMVMAHRNQYLFSLTINDKLTGVDSGQFHLQLCLERLSEC